VWIPLATAVEPSWPKADLVKYLVAVSCLGNLLVRAFIALMALFMFVRYVNPKTLKTKDNIC
jgi:hypothetical protein